MKQSIKIFSCNFIYYLLTRLTLGSSINKYEEEVLKVPAAGTRRHRKQTLHYQ